MAGIRALPTIGEKLTGLITSWMHEMNAKNTSRVNPRWAKSFWNVQAGSLSTTSDWSAFYTRHTMDLFNLKVQNKLSASKAFVWSPPINLNNAIQAMTIKIQGAHEHNLQGIDVKIGDGLTVVTGVSGSGKTSLVFDTLYHEARRRFLEVFSLGSLKQRLSPAQVEAITGLGPAVAVEQNVLNRNPNSSLASASGLHPFLRPNVATLFPSWPRMKS
jgi:hypothetical protein